ncbi:MAG: hypothetical protein ACK4XY_01765 [Chloroherpetonaceae bacterium]
MNRRHFLKSTSLVGLSATAIGSTFVGSTILSACNTSPTESVGSLENDLSFVRKGAQLEAVAIKSYQAAAASGLITNQGILDAALRFAGHHQGHLADLNRLLREFGQAEVNLDAAQPDPRVGTLGPSSTQNDVVRLAMTLEYEAGEGYFRWLNSRPSEAKIREFFVNVYPIEVAHFIVLKGVLNGGDFAGAIDNSQFKLLSRNV